jgi:hypothetical protein
MPCGDKVIGNSAGQKSYSLSETFSPDVTSPSLDQYLQLSPKERAFQDRLYFEQLMNPRRLAFLAALLKMSIRTKKQSRGNRFAGRCLSRSMAITRRKLNGPGRRTGN